MSNILTPFLGCSPENIRVRVSLLKDDDRERRLELGLSFIEAESRRASGIITNHRSSRTHNAIPDSQLFLIIKLKIAEYF